MPLQHSRNSPIGPTVAQNCPKNAQNSKVRNQKFYKIKVKHLLGPTQQPQNSPNPIDTPQGTKRLKGLKKHLIKKSESKKILKVKVFILYKILLNTFLRPYRNKKKNSPIKPKMTPQKNIIKYQGQKIKMNLTK